jgi:hypothetical protein
VDTLIFQSFSINGDMHKPAEKGKLLASKIGYKDVTRGVPI